MVNLGRLLRLNNKNQEAEFWYKRWGQSKNTSPPLPNAVIFNRNCLPLVLLPLLGHCSLPEFSDMQWGWWPGEAPTSSQSDWQTRNPTDCLIHYWRGSSYRLCLKSYISVLYSYKLRHKKVTLNRPRHSSAPSLVSLKQEDLGSGAPLSVSYERCLPHPRVSLALCDRSAQETWSTRSCWQKTLHCNIIYI